MFVNLFLLNLLFGNSGHSDFHYLIMKKFIAAYLLLLIANLTSAQHDSIYDFKENIIARKTAAPEQKVVNVGEFKEAVRLREAGHPDYRHHYASTELRQIHLCNAHHFITEHTKSYQVFMINEGHSNPNTRAFTLSLLQDLYNQGYRYFGAEGIKFEDSLLNQRGFPVIETLTYAEPLYGELLRQALEIGFKVFSYECEMDSFRNYDSLQYKIHQGRSIRTGAISRLVMDTVKNELLISTDTREKEQAENIYSILQKDPSAKIVVHAGYGHIYKQRGMMGGQFLNISHLQTYNVDQVRMEDRVPPNNDSIYQFFEITEPVVLCDSANKPFVPTSWGTRDLDVHVIHPLTKYINGRPDWMSLNGKRKPVSLKEYLKDMALPVIVTCYYRKEFDKVGYEAIPADAIQIDPGDESKPLMLQAGPYWLRIRSKSGKVLTRNITVK